MRTGRVESVWIDRRGTSVAEDVLSGTQVIPTGFPVDFDENGGQLQHQPSGVVLDYTSVDMDAETITLAAPLAEAWEQDDAVYVFPLADDLIASVRLDDAEADEESIQALVDHAMRPLLPEGTREDNSEEVAVELVGHEWVVRSIRGFPPRLDGGMVDPGTITETQISDGAITTPKISASAAWIGTMAVDQLTSGNFNAEMTLESEGGLGSASVSPGGFAAYAADGSPSFLAPTDPEQNLFFRGDAELGGLTVTGSAAFRSADNEVSTGAAVVLRDAITPPQSPPTAVNTWHRVDVPAWEGLDSVGLIFRNGQFWTCALVDGFWQIVSDTGTHAGPSFSDTRDRTVVGFTAIGDVFYYLYHQDQVGNPTRWHWILRRTTLAGATTELDIGTDAGGYIKSSGLDGRAYPTIGLGGSSDILVAYYRVDFEWFQIHGHDATTLNSTGLVAAMESGSFLHGPVTGVGNDLYDMDIVTPHYVVQHKPKPGAVTEYVKVYDAADGAYDPSNIWRQADSHNPNGLCWDGTNFWALNDSTSGTARLVRYSSWEGFSQSTQTYHTGITWARDESGTIVYETAVSPVGQVQFWKRAQLQLSSPAIPGDGSGDSPNSVRFYVGQTAESLALQETDGTQVTLTSFDVGGDDPPASSTFPSGASAVIRNTDSSLVISADGTILLPPLPIFGCWATSVQLDVPNQTWTSIAVHTDGAGAIDTHNGYTSGSYTIQVDGYYSLSGVVCLDTGNNTARAVCFTLNGVDVVTDAIPGSRSSMLSPANISSAIATPTVYVHLVAGDLIRLMGWHSHGSARDTIAQVQQTSAMNIRCIYLT